MCCSRKVILIEREIPPFHECTSPVHFFKVSESGIERFCDIHLERKSQLDND